LTTSKNARNESRGRMRSREPQPWHRSVGSQLFLRQESLKVGPAPQKKAEAELAEQRKAEKAARSYDILFTGENEEDAPRKSVREMEDDFM